MVPIPTEADEEARRAYRELEDVTGAQEVAPTGSATSNRQAEMMYLLRRQILGLNFFLRPDCVHHLPEAVRRHHSKRFRKAYEAVKRLDYDDGIIPRGARQAKLDAREGRKHNIQLGFASQRVVGLCQT
jgi:intracellular multiplication protein IcmB